MPTNNWHPSFQPLVHRINERGMHSPHAYVWYEVDGHRHQVMLGIPEKGYNDFRDGGSIEEATEELIENLETCSEDRHIGRDGVPHGRKHNVDGSAVHKAAMKQLLTTEYDREYTENKWKQQMYRVWDGHIPAAVMVPREDDPSKWELLIPDVEGNARRVPMRNGVMDDALPTPTPETANKLLGYGWKSVEAESGDKRLARLDYENRRRRDG